MTTRIVSTDDLERPSRRGPMQQILDGISDEYLTFRDLAERYNVHIETMRNICRNKDSNGNPLVKAPSQAAVHGKVIVYLFDKKDVKEVDAYMEKRGQYPTKGD